MNARNKLHARRGAAIVQVTLTMTVLVGCLALAIDMGRLYVAKSELQASADAACLAGAITLLDEARLKGGNELDELLADARAKTASYAYQNMVANVAPEVPLNSANDPAGDIVFGYLADPLDREAPLQLTDPAQFNSVRVRVRRDSVQNGSIVMSFAQLLGFGTVGVSTTACASFQDAVAGYRVTGDTGNAHLLPFALHKNVWLNLLATGANGTNDNYAYDPASGEVYPGPDGVPELNLYPGAGNGQLPPGNFGTVDIGSENNSTADISRQIREGINAADLSYFGGELRFGTDGTLLLNGDTGLSAAVKDDLQSIIGEPRSIPLFTSVSGPGNNAYFTCTAFTGIRIMFVRLTGSMKTKQVIVQPAVDVDDAAISEPGVTSYYVYRPVMLTR